MSPKPAVLSLFFAAFLFTGSSAGASDTLSVIHKFLGGSDGDDPSAMIQGSDGDFYGTTWGGGATGQGTVFKITTSGVLTTLYTFCPKGLYHCSDGAGPFAGLVQATDGNFYGTYCSVIFQIKPQGQETVLHTMTAADGQQIANSLLQADDGNFYGVTTTGGENNAGTVFKLAVPGSH